MESKPCLLRIQAHTTGKCSQILIEMEEESDFGLVEV
jgi:hypothetical protein